MDVLFFSTIADQIKKEINHKCGLNISQTRILLYFDETYNQSLAMGKLAEALNISLSTLSRQLQQKKTQNYIKIARSEKDSSKIVSLSDEGIKKAKELKDVLAEIEKSLFVYLDQDASTLFIKQLNEIAQTSASLEKTE
ncbi:MarR family transcriptional regulator [Lactobacillus amylovorus]|jgi:DNA-binding MarR family transcriptional regulator|uniref:MarR family transcriptional regulator n=1 Tax=Lactobacillus amylovorus TaxID=1604 RepID=A0A5B8EEK1_LACAM|nr:winged helix-turn-helix transcriptional regulator [Lactobacillus amylovorus]QDD70313.1 MarR family transcriptional regulator [Lactobacillus amylovorus]